MGMAMKLADYLRAHPVQFDLLTHSHTGNSLQSAEAMHLPPRCLAKAVVLEDEKARMVMAVLPVLEGASHMPFSAPMGGAGLRPLV